MPGPGGLATDQPVQAEPVHRLAVRGAPRLGAEWIDYPAAVREPLEPRVEGLRLGGAQQGEHQALDPDARLVADGVGAGGGHGTGELTVCDGLCRPSVRLNWASVKRASSPPKIDW